MKKVRSRGTLRISMPPSPPPPYYNGATLFHYFISLETANTQKIEVFLFKISSGNVNASAVVTCQYPQIYYKIP